MNELFQVFLFGIGYLFICIGLGLIFYIADNGLRIFKKE